MSREAFLVGVVIIVAFTFVAVPIIVHKSENEVPPMVMKDCSKIITFNVGKTFEAAKDFLDKLMDTGRYSRGFVHERNGVYEVVLCAE